MALLLSQRRITYGTGTDKVVLDNWRRLVTRYDCCTESYVAFLTIACFMLTLVRILG
jgi:hypothetical protein